MPMVSPLTGGHSLATNAFRSRIAHFNDSKEKKAGETLDNGFEYFEDGIVEVKNGKISILGDAKQLIASGFDPNRCEEFPKHLMMAGFIDAHVHAPQLNVMGSYGKQLLDWLEEYTFPEEIKFDDQDYSLQQNQRFVSALLSNGVTSAMVFATRHPHSAEQLFSLGEQLNMRLITGKVLMDRNAPQTLLDEPGSTYSIFHQQIQRWHNHQRLGYALTPRFAGSSTPQQLAAVQTLLKEFPDLWLQSHLSENKQEVSWTQELFPEAKDYLDIYENYGYNRPRSIFAHCIHLSPGEIQRLSAGGSSIAFCPSSNLFLGSGLFDLQTMLTANIPVAMASDVGGGTSLSPFATMADAYKICQLQNFPLDAKQAFYLTSLGAAKALAIDEYVGNLNVGKEADFILLNPANNAFLNQRVSVCKNIEEELFAYMILGDERLVDRTYVAGKLQYAH